MAGIVPLFFSFSPFSSKSQVTNEKNRHKCDQKRLKPLIPIKEYIQINKKNIRHEQTIHKTIITNGL